jgi:hypothetical protein
LRISFNFSHVQLKQIAKEENMATIINNPPPTSEERSNGTGFLIGIVLLIVFLILFFNYALPALRGAGSTNVNVPEQVDVNVNAPAGGESAPEGAQ